MSELKKWENNALNDSNFRQVFNGNVDVLNNRLLDLMKYDSYTKSRIDNLILNVSGNDITEVVDARTSLNGTIHPTLSSRLTVFEQAMANLLAEMNTRMAVYEQTNRELEAQLKAIYGAAEANLELYVDASKGNDTTGTGALDAPFKTINKAVQQIPRAMNSSAVYINIVPGTYNEDVYIRDKQISAIFIRGTNSASVEPSKSQTGVFVRHINFQDCLGYLSIVGLNQINADQTPQKKGTFVFTRCGYASVGLCRFDDSKAKTNLVPAIVIDSGKGGAHSSYFLNQYAAQIDQYTSHSNFPYTNTGAGNTYGVISDASIVQINPPFKVEATTQTLTKNGGMLV
ncbi:hypothetical protein [Listeria newyorkensis]|uniref:hypothetical protein n=1 Tax=Listeria newyorkensis TaxID=1497681 RepID=UPI00051DAED7|nr:hypothetical protein [Listeria newyorkensis]KGL44132.1 hypothetical protein EP58_06700 [Listeria newyorkensis]SQC57706.1 Uncharacterised protein [Listeria newyorkensis]